MSRKNTLTNPLLVTYWSAAFLGLLILSATCALAQGGNFNHLGSGSGAVQDWYPDNDEDGRGAAFASPISSSTQPFAGYVPNGDDCNDFDPLKYINAPCNDGNHYTVNDSLDTNCNCVSGESGCMIKDWEFTYGGSGNEVVRDIIQVNDSTYLLVGETFSPISGEVSQASRGSADGWVICIDTAGAVKWDKRYGGSASDSFFSAARTNDGGLIFAGLTRSAISGEVSQSSFSSGVDDVWVVRTDANGNLLWDKRFGGSGVDYANNIFALNDGSFTICGTSNSPASGNKTAPNVGDRDLWFIHIDATGNLIWDVAYGGSGNEFLEGAFVDALGVTTAISTTYSVASGNISLPQRGSPDLWAVQLTASGSLVWERRYGGTGQEFAGDIVAHNSGFMIGGSSSSPVGFDVFTSNLGFSDGWLLNIDNGGNPLSDHHHGGAGFERINALAPLLPGMNGTQVAFAGKTSSPVSGSITDAPRGQDDYYWGIGDIPTSNSQEKRCGTSAPDQANALIVTLDGGYLMAGYTQSDADQDKHQNSRGSGDFWVVKLAYTPDTTWYQDEDGDGYLNSDFQFTGCVRPFDYFLPGSGPEDCNDADPFAYNGAPCDDGDPDTENDTYTNSCACIGETLSPLPVRMALEGAWNSGSSAFLDDDLRLLGVLPLTEPYTALGYTVTENPGAQMDAALMNLTGATAPVDHILIELRNANDPTLIIASRVGILQRNMEVVAMDGSPFRMRAPSDGYHIVVRHRNHLGVMTAQPILFGGQIPFVDFSDGQLQTFGTEAQRNQGMNMLWAGDVNGDGTLRYIGQANDRDLILIGIGGSIPTNTTNGYLKEDVNMDGTVKYIGSSNDRDIILGNIGGNSPTVVRQEQLP